MLPSVGSWPGSERSEQLLPLAADLWASQKEMVRLLTAVDDKVSEYEGALERHRKRVKDIRAEYERQSERVRRHNELEGLKAANDPFYRPNYWDHPDYPSFPDSPKPPSFGAETDAFRQLHNRLQGIKSRSNSLAGFAERELLTAHLRDAAEALSIACRENADILATAIRRQEPSPEEDEDQAREELDKQKLGTLRRTTFPPAMQNLSQAVRRAATKYGVPTGTVEIALGGQVGSSPTPTQGKWTVNLGSYADYTAAQAAMNTARAAGFSPWIVASGSKEYPHTVVLGRFDDKKDAEALAGQATRAGLQPNVE